MKKLFAILTLCLMCVGFCLPVTAMAAPSLLVDEADVLTDDEEADLLQRLSEASAKYHTDIAAVLTNDVRQKITPDMQSDSNDPITVYTDYYILNNGYGQGSEQDAILFLVDVSGREYHFSTHGQTIYAFTDAGIDELGDQVTPYLSAGDYAGAVDEFCEDAAGMIDYKNVNGKALYQSEKNSGGKIGFKAVIAIVLGLIFGFSVTGKMKAELKSVRHKAAASDYFRADELQLTGQKETFLYHNVSRVPINNDSKGGGGGFSTHSSGGSSFGGGGGKF